MSPSTLCRELPLEELILLARHASRVSGYISLKSLAEYFPSLDIKTHLLILENLLRTRHIKRSLRGYYVFTDPENILETEEIDEEKRALANAKKIVERVSVNLPLSVVEKEQSVSIVDNTVVDPNYDIKSYENGNYNDSTVQAQELVDNGTSDSIPEPSTEVEVSQRVIRNPLRAINTDLKSSASSTPKCNGSQKPMDPRMTSRTPTFTAEVRRSAQGIKRKLDACRNVSSSVPQDVCPPVLESQPETLSETAPEPSDAVSDGLTECMAALQIVPGEDIPSQASEDRGDAADGDFIEDESASKSSAGSLDPGAPEFTPNSTPFEAPLQSTTIEHPELIDVETLQEGAGTAEAATEALIDQELVCEEYASTPNNASTHVNLLPPPPKPRPVPLPANGALPKTSITSGATSSRGSVTPPYVKARDGVASKFHWTKKKTGDEVEDPCEALEVFCRQNRLKGPAYNVIYLPSDDAYLCLLMVGKTPFKSYPTMSRTKKRAMEVAAEKAVATLGITASMVARYRGSESSM